MSINYDDEFKAILCHKNSIMNSLGSMLFGMKMYNEGMQYNFVFKSLGSNGTKRYNQSDLYVINNLGVSGQTGGNDQFNEDIDKEFICLVNHAKTYMTAIVAVKMAQQALSDGRSYIFAFIIKGRGMKNYNSDTIVKLDAEARGMSKCCALDDPECITRCCQYFGCST